MDNNHQPIDKSELLENLAGRFSLEELKTLASEVGVHADDIAGQTRPEKARELIDYLERRGRLDELVAAAAKARPEANWPGVPVATEQQYPPQKKLSTSEVRELLSSAFDDVELSAFCLDHFPAVYDRFSADMRKDLKIHLLIDYCRRSDNRYSSLLKALQDSMQ